MFPLTAKRYEKKEKYFHIVLLIAGMFHCMRQSHDIDLCIQSASYTYQTSCLFISFINSLYQQAYRSFFNFDHDKYVHLIVI